MLTGGQDPAGPGFAQAQVSFQFTHRAGVGVEVIGNWLAWPFLT